MKRLLIVTVLALAIPFSAHATQPTNSSKASAQKSQVISPSKQKDTKAEAQTSDTETSVKPLPEPTVPEAQNHLGLNQKDIEGRGRDSVDRAISVLNIVATLIGVLVGLITLVVVVAVALGVFQWRKWQSITKDMQEKLAAVKGDADAAREDLAAIKELRSKGKEIMKELRHRFESISVPPLSEQPTEDIKEKFDDFGRRLDILELIGVPLIADDYIKRADDLFYKGKYELTLKAFEKALELKPDDHHAWTNKGVTLSKLGRNEEALEACEKAIKLKPDFPHAWNIKGGVLIKLGRNEEALEACEKAIKLKPDFLSALSNKGVALIKLGRNEEALEACEKAIELKSDNAKVWYNCACAYSLLGKKGEALSKLKKAIDIDPSLKEAAKKEEEEDFKLLWDDADFKKLVGGEGGG